MLSLLGRLVVPLSFSLFALAFYRSTSGLAVRVIAFPHFAIGVILLLSLLLAAKEVSTAVRGRAVVGGVGLDHIGHQDDAVATDLRSRAARTWMQYGRSVLTTVLLVAYVYSIPQFGFLTATAGFLVTMMLVLGFTLRQTPIAILAVLGYLAFFQILFGRLLRVMLP